MNRLKVRTYRNERELYYFGSRVLLHLWITWTQYGCPSGTIKPYDWMPVPQMMTWFNYLNPGLASTSRMSVQL